MMHSRFFTLSGATLLFSGLFVACGDGEPNDPGGTGGGGGEVECSLVCAGTCVDSQNDPSNCGACGQACGAAELCSEGECVEAGCREGQLVCGNACVTTSTDRNHCGACGTECSASEICEGGSCVPADCREGQVLCGDACTTVATDRANCGSCGTTCGVAELCVAGQCELSCTNGLIACGTSCVNPLADPQYCGATECSDGAGGASNGVECGEREACVIGECRPFTPLWAPGQEVVSSTTLALGEEQSLAMDSNGNAFVLFRQQVSAGDDSSYRTFVVRYEAATKTFGEPVALDPEGTARVRNLKIAASQGGDALAVWVAGTVGDSTVMSAHYDASTGEWGEATRLDDVDSTADTPDVVMNASGDALVAWSQTQSDGGEYSIYVRRWVGGALQSVEELAHQGTIGQLPRVAMNDAGVMAVVFEEFDGNADIWYPRASLYDSGWTIPVDLRAVSQQGNGDWGRRPSVGIDGSGNVTAVFDNDVYNADVSIFESVFDAGLETWSEPVEVDGVNGPDLMATNARVAVGSDGNAVLVFQVGAFDSFADLTDFGDIYGVLRGADGNWSSATLIGEIAPSTVRTLPRVQLDSVGNAFAFWPEPTKAVARRHLAGDTGWGALSTLSTNDVTAVVSPDLAVAPSGNALASWIQVRSGVPGAHLFVARFD